MTAHRNIDALDETSRYQRNLRANLDIIRQGWPHMLYPAKAITYSIGGSSGARTSTPGDQDNGDHNRDVDHTDVVISLRGDITIILNGWCRVVMEDFNVARTLPLGHDVPGMCAFLERWSLQLAEHEAAGDIDDEIRYAAEQVSRITDPRRKDWLIIGDCPCEIVDDETGEGAVCGGKVRAWPDIEGRHDPRCMTCGTEAVLDWWMARIVGNPATAPLVTIHELISIIAYQTGRVVPAETIKTWRKRGKIRAESRDAKGRALYRHAEVVRYIVSGEVA